MRMLSSSLVADSIVSLVRTFEAYASQQLGQSSLDSIVLEGSELGEDFPQRLRSELGERFSAAQGEGGPYSPLALLRALLPASWSTAVTFGAFLLSALALTGFLRQLGLSEASSAFGGAFSTGAIFFLLPWPPNEAPRPQRDPSPPFHKGHVDLSTGLYVRVDEDLVVAGVPEVVLRRAYLSNYHVSRQFGVGATHDGEVYLIGDGQRFQWASLILANAAVSPFARAIAGLRRPSSTLLFVSGHAVRGARSA